MTTPCVVVVHLVHGTWPFGPFRRSSGDKKAWFENGSAVRKSIENQVRCEIEFREFRWSGRNSFSARRKACTEFDNHLDKALMEIRDAKHVVIAHSHGGTVAARTIALRSSGILGECKIKALVCLATPFAYLSSVGRAARDELLLFGAEGSIVTALLALAFVPSWIKRPEFNPWFVFVLGLFSPILFSLLFKAFRSYADDDVDFPTLHPSIPIFLIRATRDEAALAIGLAQSMHALSQSVYKSFDEVPGRSFLWCGIFAIFSMIGIVIAKWIVGDHLFDAWQDSILVFVFASGAASLIYLGGYALIALMVGFTNIRSWPATVEVDAAPPNRECSFKSYIDLEDIEATSLRHGIYELPAVQRELASIIQSVADGAMPKLSIEQPDAPYEIYPHWVVEK